MDTGAEVAVEAEAETAAHLLAEGALVHELQSPMPMTCVQQAAQTRRTRCSGYECTHSASGAAHSRGS